MKKALNTLFIVIVGLLAFVACTPQASLSDELVCATLTTSDRTRALIADVDFDISDVSVWKYTAAKADNGLATGATADQVALSSSGETQALSQGSWNFNLYGYRTEVDPENEGKTIEKLICSGYIDNANVTLDDHDITITVKPSQTKNGVGNIVIDEGIGIADSEGNPYTIKTGNYQYTKDIAVYTNGSETPLGGGLTGVSSGVYKVVVTYTSETNSGKSYTAATGEKTFNVYDNLTTTVSGTVQESVQAATIKGEGVFSADATGIIPAADTKLTLEVNATPLGIDENKSKITSVEFPANSLTATSTESNDVKLTVRTTSIETASSTYSVADNGATVAAFDLTLSGATIAKENDGIEITTYVVPGLDMSKLSIKYVEDESDKTATITSYDPKTGLLTFKVKHFSEYILTTKEHLVYDTTTLVSALLEGRNVKLAQDIVLNYEEVKRLTNNYQYTINIKKTVEVDFNGRSLFPNGYRIQIFNGSSVASSHVVTFKNGKIDGTNNSNRIAVINGKLILDKMTLSAPEGNKAGVVVQNPNLNPSLEINDSTISVNGDKAVELSNGTSVYGEDKRTVTITNSNLSGSYGFYISDKGDDNDDVTISGCTINGEKCGVYINGSNYTIKDTTISVTKDTTINVTGTEAYGCALYLNSSYATKKSQTWYYTPTSVTIENVKLSVQDSENQKAIIATVNSKYSAGCKITLSGTLTNDSADSISYMTYSENTYTTIEKDSMTEEQQKLFAITCTKATE